MYCITKRPFCFNKNRWWQWWWWWSAHIINFDPSSTKKKKLALCFCDYFSGSIIIIIIITDVIIFLHRKYLQYYHLIVLGPSLSSETDGAKIEVEFLSLLEGRKKFQNAQNFNQIELICIISSELLWNFFAFSFSARLAMNLMKPIFFFAKNFFYQNQIGYQIDCFFSNNFFCLQIFSVFF